MYLFANPLNVSYLCRRIIKHFEVDFYVPDAELAIQVCYSLRDADTRKRETETLITTYGLLPGKHSGKVQKVLTCTLGPGPETKF